MGMASACNSSGSQNQKLVVIEDNPKPRVMPLNLFGEVPDSLVSKLGIQDGIPSSVSVFLIEKDGKQILFDAGNGTEDSQLMPRLQQMGWTAEAIDYIFITHLHGDHIGGLMQAGQKAFPNAKLYIPEVEMNAWMNMPEGASKNVVALKEAYQDYLVLFKESDVLPNGVRAIAAPGHTPGHTLYQVDDQLIGGDIMHGVALQLEYPDYCARFDMNRQQAIESRKKVLELVAREGLRLYGMHFPTSNPVITIPKDYLLPLIPSGPFKAGHIQGMAIDLKNRYVYCSYTTMLVKSDFRGNIIGTVTGLLGHLGDMDFNEADGRVYGSLEYKNDAIGKGIMQMEKSERTLDNAFYIAIFDVNKIDRIGMDAEKDGIMTTVYLPTVLDDYLATVEVDGKKHEHRLGCSGIDGVSFGPQLGKTDGKEYLTVGYGIYGDIQRTDNDYQVLLQYDVTDWKKYEQPLSQAQMHTQGPSQPNGQYFIFTGNTTYGVQNLEYDPVQQKWWMAVYKGKKPQYSNYSLFAFDARTQPQQQALHGVPYIDQANVISETEGWMQNIGSTGFCAIGNGKYYISHSFKNEQGQGSNLRLYQFSNGEQPFEPIQ